MKKLRILFVLFATAMFTTSIYAVECVDDCGSIDCPGSWCGIAYDYDTNTTTYTCGTGQTSTAENCTVIAPA